MQVPRARLLLVILVAAALSGCLGQTAAPPQEAPAAPGGAEDPVEASSSAAWRVGDDWRYEVSGSRIGTPYTVRVAVVEHASGGYALALDHPKEHALSAAGLGGVLAGPVQADTLAPRLGGVPRDLLGITRSADWEAVFLGTKFVLTRGALATALGPGHSVTGIAANGETLYIEYRESAAWFTRLEWRDGGGQMILGYALLDRPGAGLNGLTSWHTFAAARASATQDRVATATLTSNGKADLVLAVAVAGTPRLSTQVTTGSGGSSSLLGGLLDQATSLLGTTRTLAQKSGVATATVMDPQGSRVLDFHSNGGEFVLKTASDKAGDWQLAAGTSGPNVDLVVYRVRITTY